MAEKWYTECSLKCDIPENFSCFFNFLTIIFILLEDDLYNMPGLSSVNLIQIKENIWMLPGFEIYITIPSDQALQMK